MTAETPLSKGDRAVLTREHLGLLLEALRARGFRVIGPRLRAGAIVLDDLSSLEQLPVGWHDRQAGGTYRLERRADEALFGHAVGQHSWRQYFFAPTTDLVRLRRQASTVTPEPLHPAPAPLALFGARACDLHAIAIQDLIFLGGIQGDRDYAERRRGSFVVAVNCSEPGGTCFCASMGTGPRATLGFDLALSELLDGEHRFFVEIGTTDGADLLRAVGFRPAMPEDEQASERLLAEATAHMGRSLSNQNIVELMYGNLEHPRWDEVATRCLACTNCTLVCPTCFCSTIEDLTDLPGQLATRRRRWDSCFTLGHSYLHGGCVRSSTKSRYRQWLTHKVASWFDQFGMSGCVGCGRCITWCPAGIDITEEVAAIRSTAALAAN